MLVRFFIDRPVLAWVISLVILLMGAIAAVLLPIAQYPEITPPVVRVTASYPGANARIVADTVAAPIEQQVNGVEKMLYMSSQSNNDGSYVLDVTFAVGTDSNMAQVLVQNRVAIAQPTLPDMVKAIGVTVRKRSPDILLIVNLYSEVDQDTKKPYYDQLYLSNYATIHLQDALARIDGVGDVFAFGGQDYSMRVWLDPDRLQARNLTAGDVIRVLREQNVQVAAGQIGQPPVPQGQDFQFTMNTLGRLVEAEEFGDIILKTGADGEVVRLKDVGRTELGAKNQDYTMMLDGKPAAGLAIFQLPGSNALEVADHVKARMRELERRFPTGLRFATAYDTTPFVRESVAEVFHTLRDAVILVALVVLLFLQDWKSLLLPVIDVACVAGRHLRRDEAAGLLAEQLDLVRAGVGHRHRRGRRHRRAGEHRALAGQGVAGPRGHHSGDGRDHRADHGHHAGAQFRAAAQRFPGRHHRPVLPAVRPDDRRVDAHFRRERHDDDASAGGLDLR